MVMYNNGDVHLSVCSKLQIQLPGCFPLNYKHVDVSLKGNSRAVGKSETAPKKLINP